MNSSIIRTVKVKSPGDETAREVEVVSTKREGNLYRKIRLKGLNKMFPAVVEKFTLIYAQNRAFENGQKAIARCGERIIYIWKAYNYEYH
ncbi:hypothetical protein SDC9_58940 [bioreactor metagenome]|uniref:Uncharacterized protein n=1 Tax=bioreactor metagenome TaxID=1076179 RepID=A0A644X9J8_9ZZZZ